MDQTAKLSRNKFLKELGLQGAALMAVYCAGSSLSGCKSNDAVTPATTSGTTVDLSNSANAALLKQGGYIVTNSIVVANTSKGYVAVTQICSHEGERQIILRNDQFYCTAHGALYDLTGKGLNANGSRGIRAYTVTQSGNILTIS